MAEPAEKPKGNNEKLDAIIAQLGKIDAISASVEGVTTAVADIDTRLKALEKPAAGDNKPEQKPAAATGDKPEAIDYDKLGAAIGAAVGSKIEALIPGMNAGADSGAGTDTNSSAGSDDSGKFDPKKPATLQMSKAEYRAMRVTDAKATGMEKAKIEARADQQWEADRKEAAQSGNK